MSGVVPGPQEDKKPVIDQKQTPKAEKPSHINITVKKNDDNTEVAFRIRRSSQFSKLISAYCEMKKIDNKTYRFLYDGKRLDPKQTPDDIEMEADGDQIDVMLEQDGGGKALNVAQVCWDY
ncbi:hypothetical protein C5167_033683 [Papaver somniferum]|uniref:Small ubiquitin-related modifier n=1 Tax=Papaver somniferum TaxID=3469 RepID=A0A4Y7KAE3_PAPSO|nr:small ubiquitin-related modifier 2-like [Papaver somniferum]RZC68899.1 hypothetical protein C5167_033683 [Papaver somniferum]